MTVIIRLIVILEFEAFPVTVGERPSPYTSMSNRGIRGGRYPQDGILEAVVGYERILLERFPVQAIDCLRVWTKVGEVEYLDGMHRK